ncbi:Cof-type HAD-IIB family hydrolase [Heyndrickxia oleronia]|uniref:Cof-type HAD-IIB family hydrolase n=1 Tax=Heyndrickxia oleronia TaxID=38875 RepID=UPI001C0F1C46|nr:Cof-type HAD-IIB family hydrolase [Heyndrickxia oleronia]MBU5210902.1 Cof-type HAD-IIB family hydrolase [Heyndrickxia oleronia]
MKKIVFFDIDGTLLDNDKKLPESTKEAIWKLKESGVFVAIATGRAPFMFKELREELEIDSFVSFNGQYVVFENKVIYKNPLDPTELENLINYSASHKHPLVFLNEKEMTSNIENHQFIRSSIESLKIKHPSFDPDFYKGREIYQSLLFCEEKDEVLYLDKFKKFYFLRWHEFSMDVLPKGGSKAEGIKKMIEKIGFKLEDVYAFGDGLNDIEMLEAVGTGIAMGNALDVVKQHANYVTTDVMNNGIANGLKHFKLI